MRTKGCLRPMNIDRLGDPGGDAKSLHESRLRGLVLRARAVRIRPQHDAANRVRMVGDAKTALTHGSGNGRENSLRRAVRRADEDDDSGLLDRFGQKGVGVLTRFWIVVREVVERDVEEDGLRVKAGQVIDHFCVV